MNKEGRFQTVLIILLAVAVVGMSIGFAALQTQLTINGNATFKAAKWEVIWDNSTVAEVENGTEGTYEITNNNLNVNYTVTLKPNTSYKLTVDAINKGTFDAKLNSINFTGLSPAEVTSQYSPKISYIVTYGGTAYSQNTDTSSGNILLPKETGRTPLVVTLTYPMPGSEADLLDEDTTLTLGVQLNFVPVVE